MLEIENRIQKKCNSAIVISGVARSGTTIISRIIHSLKNVELIFESRMLNSIILSANKIPPKTWRLLYSSYLYEEFLINALAGRNINTNKNDYSYILKVKDKKDINKRLAKTWGDIELKKLAQASQIAYKMPGIVPYIPKIQTYYPGTKPIIILRNANDVFHSLKKRAWLSDKHLKFHNEIWINKIYQGLKIPHAVKKEDAEYFAQADELHRIAYYYIRMNENLGRIKNGIFIKYEDLINNPQKEVKNIAKKLNLSYGPKTQEIIDSIKLTSEDRNKNLLAELDGKIRKKVLKVSLK